MLGLTALLWALGIVATGGFDTVVLGVRLRANDPFEAVLVAVICFGTLAVMRWRARPARVDLRSMASAAAILVVAAIARFWAIGFGLPHTNTRPDEGAVASIAGGIYQGDLVPDSFNYPPLFMMAVALAMAVWVPVSWLIFSRGPSLVARVGIRVPTAPLRHPANGVTERLTGRVLSALSGIATVWVLFLTTRRLCGRRAGLIAAAFLSLAFLHVRDSHFGVTDVPMTFALLAAFLQLVRLSESGSPRDLVTGAVLAGLATATKYNAALLVLPAAWAIVQAPGPQPTLSRIGRLAVFLAIMAAVFLAICPGAIVTFDRFVADVSMESRHLAEGHGADLGRGWLYHATTTLRYGLGLPLLLTAVAGMFLLVVRQPRKGILVAAFPVAYYILIGAGRTVFARYVLPLLPFLCLTAGYAVAECAEWVARRVGKPHIGPAQVAAALTVLILWPSAMSVVQFDRLLARTDSRLIVKQWIETRFPPGTTIAQIGPEGARVFQHEGDEVRYAEADVAPGAPRPTVVIVQSSPLTGTPDLGAVAPILEREYEVAMAQNAARDDPRDVYDRQDEFYLPIAGFKGVERPGPNLKVYVKK